jgi:hypothetical protein
MADLLIRDVPDDVVSALDTHAARLGLARFADSFGELAAPDVMSQAWQRPSG